MMRLHFLWQLQAYSFIWTNLVYKIQWNAIAQSLQCVTYTYNAVMRKTDKLIPGGIYQFCHPHVYTLENNKCISSGETNENVKLYFYKM